MPEDRSNLLINGRSLAEILAMPSRDALLYLEAAKTDIPTMQAAYDHELANDQVL